MQAVDARPRLPSQSALPLLALLLLGLLVAAGVAAFDWLALLPVFGLVFFALVLLRPEYGIAMFLSTFLVTYPAALQGTGSLTINNVLGGVFILLLTYKLYREQDWWFLHCRELQLLAFIFLVFFVADKLNGPDPHILQLMGGLQEQSESTHTFLTRSIFTLFFVNFIETRRHVAMIFVLALLFMIVSAFSGTWSVMHGGGLHGYRAVSSVISVAANPNRLAMFAIIPIAGLWYLMRRLRGRGLMSAVAPALILPFLVVLTLAVFMTGSRSGLIGLAVCLGAIMLDEGLGVAQIATIAVAGVLVLLLVIQFVPEKTYERITNLPFTQGGESGIGSGSLSRRFYTWVIALKMFEQHPIVGIGIGNWQLERFVVDPTHSNAAPHSSYILAAVEGGALCLGGFLLLLWWTWRNFLYVEPYICARGSPLVSLSWVVKGAKVSLLVLVFFSLFADLWQYVILFWLVGLSIVLQRLLEQAPLAEAEGV